ncbi:MAG: PAS domain S-box protein, partial [Sphingomicrobium sp.]
AAEAQREVIETERTRLAAIARESRDFIGITDLEGNPIFLNEAGRAMVGVPDLETVRSTQIIDYFAPEDHETILNEVLPAARVGYWEGELHFRHFQTGEIIPVLYNIFPVRTEEGEMVGYGTVTRDLTERKRAEAEAREQMAEFQALADNMPALCWMAYADGHIYWYNQRWYEYTGTTSGELEGWGWQSVHDPEVLPDVIAQWQHSIECGEPFEMTFPLKGADGVFRPFLTRVVPIRDERGAIERWFGTNVDITDQERTRTDLRALNETLELRVAERTAERDRAWNVSQDLFVICGFDGFYRVVNPAWTEYLGYSQDELVGTRFDALVHPDDIEATVGQVERLIRGEIIDNFDIRVRASDGSYRWISWTGIPEGDTFYAAGRDVTARKELEEQLRQSQKMEAMGQLTGGVAHDFNNLLTPIVGTLDMLQRKGIGNAREQRLIAGAMQSSERARTLVQRLLAFARRQPLQLVPVDIARLVADMGDLMTSTVGPQIKVVVQAPDNLPLATADPNQLEMALLNLSVNARDAMPDGGTLRISAGAETVGGSHRSGLGAGDYVRLSVADTGAGMNEATLARAIEPFFSTKGIGKGTGLGLSMVHGLAAQLGGALTIQSRPGVGTNVELWLPRSAAAAAHVDEGAAEVASTSARRGTALLVDDEELVRMSTAEMLDDLGYAVIEAESAEEAMRIVSEGERFDVLITDHLMPGMNGTDLAHSIQAERPNVPVLLVSGYAETHFMEAGLPRLTKPFRKDELASSLAQLSAGG